MVIAICFTATIGHHARSRSVTKFPPDYFVTVTRASLQWLHDRNNEQKARIRKNEQEIKNQREEMERLEKRVRKLQTLTHWTFAALAVIWVMTLVYNSYQVANGFRTHLILAVPYFLASFEIIVLLLMYV